MRKISILGCFLLLNVAAIQAAPFVVSDPSTQTVTHCGIQLDTAAKVEVPVVNSACKYDVSGVSTGPHTIKATFINIDPVWGRSESVYSVPLDFVRPAPSSLISPSGLVIIK